MSDSIRSLRETLARGVDRWRQRPFLEAAMASSALVAMADDDVRLAEQLGLDRVLESVEQLRVFDAHVAVDLHRDYVEAIRADRRTGTDRALAAVAPFARDSEAADLLLRIAAAIGSSDSDFSEAEQKVVDQLRESLHPPA